MNNKLWNFHRYWLVFYKYNNYVFISLVHDHADQLSCIRLYIVDSRGYPGGWIGCLVTPLWVKLSTRTMKIGNHAKQIKDSKTCTVCTLSEFRAWKSRWKIDISFCTLCGRGHIPLPCFPPQLCRQCGTGLYSCSHPHSKISGSATEIATLVVSVLQVCIRL